MFNLNPDLMQDIRSRFAHVDQCPFSGERIFLENAGGALTLKSVVETSAFYASIPDNQGRANLGSKELVKVINKARQDAMDFMNASDGQVFLGESGTELIFRVVRAACLDTKARFGDRARVLGSTVEHPATRSAAMRWADLAGLAYDSIDHDNDLGLVASKAYAAHLTPDTKVATILHTSPVTGMGMDLGGIVAEIRKVSPDCFIIVDGIQHVAHGPVDLEAYDIDAYVLSAYKVFSRHGYGLAWLSPRLERAARDCLINGPENQWELGTRDTGAYATWSDVVDYFDWLGAQVSDSGDRRERLEAAGKAIRAHEHHLTDALLQGVGNRKGLAHMDGVTIIGGVDNAAREGLVSLYAKQISSPDLVEALNARGIRTHVRRNDHYSGTILEPLGLETCVRISFCHYNTTEEVTRVLEAFDEIFADV